MFQPPQIAQASFDVRRRAKLCRVREKSGRFFVKTPEPDKDDRVVLFINEGILCFSSDTGEQCKANEIGKHCCRHVYAASRRREINRKFRATIARKKLDKRAA